MNKTLIALALTLLLVPVTGSARNGWVGALDFVQSKWNSLVMTRPGFYQAPSPQQGRDGFVYQMDLDASGAEPGQFVVSDRDSGWSGDIEAEFEAMEHGDPGERIGAGDVQSNSEFEQESKGMNERVESSSGGGGGWQPGMMLGADIAGGARLTAGARRAEMLEKEIERLRQQLESALTPQEYQEVLQQQVENLKTNLKEATSDYKKKTKGTSSDELLAWAEKEDNLTDQRDSKKRPRFSPHINSMLSMGAVKKARKGNPNYVVERAFARLKQAERDYYNERLGKEQGLTQDMRAAVMGEFGGEASNLGEKTESAAAKIGDSSGKKAADFRSKQRERSKNRPPTLSPNYNDGQRAIHSRIRSTYNKLSSANPASPQAHTAQAIGLSSVSLADSFLKDGDTETAAMIASVAEEMAVRGPKSRGRNRHRPL